MIIESSKRSQAVMLSKYGEVYPGINNSYHPYPGDKDDGYPEIETCINWICQNNISGVDLQIREWIQIRVATEYHKNNYSLSFKTVIEDILFMDDDEVCSELKSRIYKARDKLFDLPNRKVDEWADYDPSEPAEDIANFINEKFLRVREGGKLDSNGEDAIYFRISSHDYDWRRNIVEYLWDSYGDPKRMPSRIWIGHDLESNPPETVLFDGTPQELLENEDRKVYEDLKVVTRTGKNSDREAASLNRMYRRYFDKGYESFK